MNRKQKFMEYHNKYDGIPLNYEERLRWMYDRYKISDNKALDILEKRDQMLSSLYYTSLHIILYEEPEGSPRPRFKLVNRYNFSNVALENSSFVHVYSITGKEDNMYMKRLVEQKDFADIQQLIYTPCDVEYITYSKTPSYYNVTDTILSEIGLIRPLTKPDWDNIGKKYSDMYNGNVWLDDTLVIDGHIRKFYSILPRVEIRLNYMNMLYNKYQYNSIKTRLDEDAIIKYFGGS